MQAQAIPVLLPHCRHEHNSQDQSSVLSIEDQIFGPAGEDERKAALDIWNSIELDPLKYRVRHYESQTQTIRLPKSKTSLHLLLPDKDGRYAPAEDDPTSERNYFLVYLTPITDNEYVTIPDVAYLRTLPIINAQQQMLTKTLLPFHHVNDIVNMIDAFANLPPSLRVGKEDPWDSPVTERGRWVQLLQQLSPSNPPSVHDCYMIQEEFPTLQAIARATPEQWVEAGFDMEWHEFFDQDFYL